uniref:Sigma-70, region 4 n=2 Tax=Candidatus Kentrum sp. LPFa TaxID=2126335 RepID=A0A450Y425_9GAMM|nr:MAG: Sigma-70, region 4 [Candidatus Kentron sp. LPFa]
MRKIQEILRLKYESKLSHEKIAGALGLSKGAVAKYITQARDQGIVWPLPQGQDLASLEERLALPSERRPATGKAEPDFFQIHVELKRKGVTIQLLWEEYVATHGAAAYQYSRFCDLYRQWRQQQKRSMRQQHFAGEKP